jgi:hypothetical protein
MKTTGSRKWRRDRQKHSSSNPFVYGLMLKVEGSSIQYRELYYQHKVVQLVYNLLQGFEQPMPKGQIRKLLPTAHATAHRYGKPPFAVTVVAINNPNKERKENG